MSALRFRLAGPGEYSKLREMIIESFEPITWFKKLDARYGPLNGCDWRKRWERRLAHVFATQIILVGEAEGEVVAAATGTLDQETRLGFIDLLAVDQRHQRKGYGREMLRGMLAYFREAGMEHAHLDCLADNDAGNSLYRAEGWEIVASSHKWFLRLE